MTSSTSLRIHIFCIKLKIGNSTSNVYNSSFHTVVWGDRHFTLNSFTYKIVPDSPVLYPI